MLAFTDDSALARLFIAATRIHPDQRGQWLRDIAAKLDTPRHVLARRERSRRAHQRRRDGVRVWTLELPDQAAEAMITALIASGRLSEREASDRHRVAAELGRQLLWWAEHWHEINSLIRV